jgi:hypothetical protein
MKPAQLDPKHAKNFNRTVIGNYFNRLEEIHAKFPRGILTCSNEAQREAYQKCFLEYYYCATVQGELSLIFQREVLVFIYM